MNGLISKINAVDGQRDALAAILLEGANAMPGCLSYVIASDPADDKALGSLRSGTVRQVTKRRFRCHLFKAQSQKAGR